jgi:hypothetical protein
MKPATGSAKPVAIFSVPFARNPLGTRTKRQNGSRSMASFAMCHGHSGLPDLDPERSPSRCAYAGSRAVVFFIDKLRLLTTVPRRTSRHFHQAVVQFFAEQWRSRSVTSGAGNT